jgi:(2Fe-2S) ferredoxin
VSRFSRHFFVCQTQRPPLGKPSCGTRGSSDLLRILLEARDAHPELWRSVQVSGAGCLGPCFHGPAIVVYPEGVWYAPVSREDVDEIVRSHLLEGKVVERLRFEWPEV